MAKICEELTKYELIVDSVEQSIERTLDHQEQKNIIQAVLPLFTLWTVIPNYSCTLPEIRHEFSDDKSLKC